jgi:uncharacterized protein (TIGR03083 family)
VSLSSDQQLDAIRTEGSRFWDTIDAATDLEARVPSCPDWNVGDLARHLAGVHAFWTQIVDPEAVSNDRPIDTIALVGLGREALQRMVDVLASADPQQHVWTWASQQDVAFVTRHQVQEAAVHRWDAQTAAGADVDPIAPDAAADAIDEFLILARPALTKDSPPLGGSVHLHCTDVDGEWIVHADGRVEPIHAKGDVALRGTASDLLLALYSRIPLDNLDIIGDRAVAAAFLDVHLG